VTETRDVDAHDPEDSAAVEVAVGLAIAEALAHPPDISTMTAERAESIMESVVGGSLRFYSQRVLQTFVSAWRSGQPVDDNDWAAMNEAVDLAVRRAIDDTGESVRDIIRVNSAKADEALRKGARGPYTVEDGLDIEAKAYHRLREGMSGVGRILTTRTRETAKYEFATRMGAVGKAWHTLRDGRVRTSHGDLEGDFVLMDQPFVTVNGAKLMRPGDLAAPLFETINCRCRLSFRMPVGAAA
jgi:hypothetical protein